MTKRACVSLFLSLAISTAPVHAGSSPKGAPVGYEAKYKEVLEAEKGEEYEKAVGLLDQIPAEKHTVFVRLKRASLLVRLGKLVEAEGILTALLKDPKADAIRATVQGDLDDLRARMPKLTIRLAEESKANAWVTVDGTPVGPPVTLPVDPGTHLIVAKKGEVEVFRQKVTLQDSQNLEVEIDTSIAPPVGSVSAAKTVGTAPQSAPVSAPPRAAEPAQEPPRSSIGPLPFFIGGGLLAVGSVASFVLATASAKAVRDNCASQTSPTCDTNAAGASKVRTWEAFGWVSGGLAIASMGVAVVFATSGSKDRVRTTASLRPLAGGATVAWEGSF